MMKSGGTIVVTEIALMVVGENGPKESAHKMMEVCSLLLTKFVEHWPEKKKALLD